MLGYQLFAAVALLLLSSVTQAAAGACGYDYCWGAVGVGANGAYGFSHGYGSENAAIQSAQSGCKGQCTNVRTFYNTCGAIAVADNGAWGFGWNNDQELSESIAMNYCMDGGYNCQIRVWSCSK
jgi:hypothetical protein